ncbi:MAG TPA: glycine/betaine ABC transporter ATP-binding protein, partial [Anaerolineaceae bacterium]|nr:glycine/betaine ABC transporter ATP-binding protein [Anaerolineaceae bacterium]
QQQRVGIARALAADPGLLLMDEPFGAIDAITRTSLQDQLLELQQRLHKTILFVTHDVDEAFRLADQIVVMQRGRVVQFDDPCALVSRPASDFVRALLDTDDRIRQLSLVRVEAVMRPLPAGFTAGSLPTVSAQATLREALSVLLQPGAAVAAVVAEGCPMGQVSIEDLRAVNCEPEP